MAKTEPVINTVTMEDSRVVDFVGNRRILKESFVSDGSLTTRLSFINGKSINFVIPAEMLSKFAAHGAEQKLGDATAGVEDLEDAFEAVAELAAQLARGDWTAKREGKGATAGASELVRALVEHTGKTIEAIRAFLSDKTPAQKLALRNANGVRQVIERYKSEKAARSGAAEDGEALLAGLDE